MSERFSVDSWELWLQNEMLTWKNEPVGAIDGVDVHRRIAAYSLRGELNDQPWPLNAVIGAAAFLKLVRHGSA